MSLELFPVSFTSRDFAALRTELLARKDSLMGEVWSDNNMANIGVAILDMTLGAVDQLHGYLDQMAINMFPSSIRVMDPYMRETARWLDYTPRPASAAVATVTITRSDAAYQLTIPARTRVQTVGSPALTFETVSALVLAPGVLSGNVTVEHATQHTVLFRASGQPRQRIPLTSWPFLWGSEVVEVGGVDIWERVDNWLDSSSADKHYTVEMGAENGRLIGTIILPDGVNGMLPQMGSDIEITYSSGGGSIGNLPANTLRSIRALPDSSGASIVLTVTNAEPSQGGSEEETLEIVRHRAPASVSTNRRSVSRLDFAVHAEQVGGVQRAAVMTVNESSSIDENTVALLIVPTGENEDGSPQVPSVALRKKVLDYIEVHRPTLVTARVITVAPEYIDITPEVNVTVRGSEHTARIDALVVQKLRDWFDLAAVDANGEPRIAWGTTVHRSKIVDLIYDINTDLGAQIIRDVEVINPTGNLMLDGFQLPYVGLSTVTVNVEELDDPCAGE